MSAASSTVTWCHHCRRGSSRRRVGPDRVRSLGRTDGAAGPHRRAPRRVARRGPVRPPRRRPGGPQLPGLGRTAGSAARGRTPGPDRRRWYEQEPVRRVIAACDAPFPDAGYQAGARVLPSLVTATPDDPASPDNRRAWEALRSFDRPFLTPFAGHGGGAGVSTVRGGAGYGRWDVGRGVVLVLFGRRIVGPTRDVGGCAPGVLPPRGTARSRAVIEPGGSP